MRRGRDRAVGGREVEGLRDEDSPCKSDLVVGGKRDGGEREDMCGVCDVQEILGHSQG